MIWPIGLTALLSYGAVSDIRSRRLPNWLALGLLISGLTFAVLSGNGWAILGSHAAHAAIALLAGAALFAAGIIGGGDAKFYAGMASWFPLAQGINLLSGVAILGGIFVISWMIARRMRGPNNGKRDGIFAKFPYGIAIAAGGVVMIWFTQLSG